MIKPPKFTPFWSGRDARKREKFMARLKMIAFVGPTASGKTSLGLELAKRFNGEVVSVDSRQVYRGMDIGTGKVQGEREEAERSIMVEGVAHWGIDFVDPDEAYSAADFKIYADRKIREIVARGRLPILVGGTGLWLKAVIDNLDLGSTHADLKLRGELEARTLGDLVDEFKRLDPVGAQLIDCENKRRVVRALEVTKLTDRPWSQMQTAEESTYEVLQIGLSVPREELNRRINARVDEMIARGLVDEVRWLKERYGCATESMTGIGYRQICTFLDGNARLADAIEETKKATRQYAKRQMTWFRRDIRISWVADVQEASQLVETFLAYVWQLSRS